MYDTFKLILTNEYNPKINFLDNIPDSLQITHRGVEYGINVVRGRMRNLKFNIKRSKLIIEGSIHVFCKGENISPMTFSEFKEVIDELISMTGYPLLNARVSRFDFSGNILLKSIVTAYLTYFGEKSRYRKQVFDAGINYCTEELYLIFYDKIKELKRKRESIPEYFQGKNVMRFEMRFMRKLGKTFKVQELTLKHLIDPAFFNKLCHRWRDEFKSIVMEMESPIGLNPTGSKPKLLEQLAIHQVNQIGIDNFLNEISSWQAIDKITKKEAYEIRKFIKTSTSEQYPLAENELIRELNLKVKVSARYEV